MSSVILSGLTTITTISLFDGWDNLADILDDVREIACWVNSQLPENKFLRVSIYTLGSVALLRCVPFILRRTSFFAYHERELYYFHRSNNHKDIIKMKKELLNELTDEEERVKLPLYDNEKLVILEINAGSGTNASYFPAGAHVIATDWMEEEGAKLEKNFLFGDDEAKLKLDAFVHTIPEELAGVPDNSVSCVISFHALCNARKKGRALDEILRVLMPGGRLYFIEHTTVKERFTFLWLAQLNFRANMIMLSCSIDSPENYINKANFSEIFYKTVNIGNKHIGPLKSLVPHVYGYAVK